MPWSRNDRPYRTPGPSVVDRLVSVLCYFTGGIAGIIYIIISRSSYQGDFFRFHFLQSIVLAIISLLLSWALKALGLMIGPLLPWLSSVLGSGSGVILDAINMGLNGILMLYALLPLYGAIMAALGKYAHIPWLSDVVRNQMR